MNHINCFLTLWNTFEFFSNHLYSFFSAKILKVKHISATGNDYIMQYGKPNRQLETKMRYLAAIEDIQPLIKEKVYHMRWHKEIIIPTDIPSKSTNLRKILI